MSYGRERQTACNGVVFGLPLLRDFSSPWRVRQATFYAGCQFLWFGCGGVDNAERKSPEGVNFVAEMSVDAGRLFGTPHAGEIGYFTQLRRGRVQVRLAIASEWDTFCFNHGPLGEQRQRYERHCEDTEWNCHIV